MSCGVLQGSIIWLLSIIIYNNDIRNSCKNIIPDLFADDTNALCKSKTRTI